MSSVKMKITGYLHFVYHHILTHLEKETKHYIFFPLKQCNSLGLQLFSSTNSISFHVKHKFLNFLLFSPDNFCIKCLKCGNSLFKIYSVYISSDDWVRFFCFVFSSFFFFFLLSTRLFTFRNNLCKFSSFFLRSIFECNETLSFFLFFKLSCYFNIYFMPIHILLIKFLLISYFHTLIVKKKIKF